MPQTETKVQYAMKNATKAMERINALEGIVPQIITSTQNGFRDLESRLNQVAELVDAMVVMMGAEAVGAALLEARKSRHLQKVEGEKAQLSADIASGKLVPADVITEKSTVVLTERDREGKELPISRVQFTFAMLTPEVRKEVLGQMAGYTIKPPEANTFEVIEIYNDVSPAATPQAEA